MSRYKTKKEQRFRRHARVRHKVSGTAEKPRLCVSFTNKHIYAQMVDDETSRTLFSVASVQKSFVESGKSTGVEGAGVIGGMLAEKAVAAGIKQAVFDRGGYRYHGRVKAIADAARQVGLAF